MLFCFFSSLIGSITIPFDLGIEYYFNDLISSPTNGKGMPDRGLISTTRCLFWQPISYVTVSLTLCFFFPLSDGAHQSTYDLFLCSSLSFISVWRASSISKSLTIRYSMPACALIFVKKSIPRQGRFSIPKSFVDYPPTPIMRCIPKNHWYLILNHLDDA